MTVKEFDDKRRDAERVREGLQKGVDAIGKAFEIMQAKKTKIPDATMDLVRPELNQAIMAANEAVKKLRDYEGLMDDIARKSELDWPPSCGQSKP